jgi:hypothetical protein
MTTDFVALQSAASAFHQIVSSSLFYGLSMIRKLLHA